MFLFRNKGNTRHDHVPKKEEDDSFGSRRGTKKTHLSDRLKKSHSKTAFTADHQGEVWELGLNVLGVEEAASASVRRRTKSLAGSRPIMILDRRFSNEYITLKRKELRPVDPLLREK